VPWPTGVSPGNQRADSSLKTSRIGNGGNLAQGVPGCTSVASLRWTR
jgi:hypothetical protein